MVKKQINAVQAIEFYSMPLHTMCMQPYYGAVIFGPRQSQGCEIMQIITPVPTLELLYDTLLKAQQTSSTKRLVFTKWNRNQVMEALGEFCSGGWPLPLLFNNNIATLDGFTEFQLHCYKRVSEIPHGETRSYAWVATKLKKPGAVQAVGQAMKTNPFPLLIPCHRIVSQSGGLGGYLGITQAESWQMHLKKQILTLEGLYQQPSLFSLPMLYPSHAAI